MHVTEGGGSFGRKLFSDAALEAAEVSQAMGKPVKLMWHRTDDFRQGRTHPMSTVAGPRHHTLAGKVLTYEQRHTSVGTDFTHGLGEIITAAGGQAAGRRLGFSETIFDLTQQSPYNFGVTTQLLNEVDKGFNTGSMRNIYSPNVRCAQELIVDQLAKEMGKDPYRSGASSSRTSGPARCWRRSPRPVTGAARCPQGSAQGIAAAPRVPRRGRRAGGDRLPPADRRTGRCRARRTPGRGSPRSCAPSTSGCAVNPRGLEAQMMGGIMDGIALALTSSLHLKDGHFLEGSWDDYFYTRQWNTPPELEIIVMPPTTGQPGRRGRARRGRRHGRRRLRLRPRHRHRSPTSRSSPSTTRRAAASSRCPPTPPDSRSRPPTASAPRLTRR